MEIIKFYSDEKQECHAIVGMLFFIMLSSSKCDKPPLAEVFYGILVKNYSSDTIYSGLGWGYRFPQYPDTSLPDSKPNMISIPAQLDIAEQADPRRRPTNLISRVPVRIV